MRRIGSQAWCWVGLVLTLLGSACLAQGGRQALSDSGTAVLKPEEYHHYASLFREQERAATGKTDGDVDGADSWAWMNEEIPWFDASDKRFEEMYYFRWYAWRKHLVETDRGFVITEWLPKPEMKDGSYGALPDAAPFHIAEARWLRDRKIAEDDARFWSRSDTDSHKYSDAMAWTVRGLTEANGDTELGTDLLPALKASYGRWETEQRDANGLFWSIDSRDAMEKSISGDGYRPTLNSYMYGDARAIAEMARVAGDEGAAKEFDGKADVLKHLIESRLWNPRDSFYEVISPAPDSGIRKQKKFIDPDPKGDRGPGGFSGVREEIGYTPWVFGIPAAEHGVAWKQLFDAQGFDGRYGPTTAERRSPRFRFASSDQCTWNGPMWPFATTETLLAMAAFENGPSQSFASKADFLKLFSRYVDAQHLKLADGKMLDWIDEDLDADTDEWIAKRMLIEKNKQVGRGNYYNHSGFADPLITGLVGLRPSDGKRITVNPLLPEGTWSYFAMDGLPYHGHLLTVLWDADGKHYRRGKGLQLMVDGKKIAARKDLGRLEGMLP